MIATVTMNPSLDYHLQVDHLPVNVTVPAKGTLTAIGGIGIHVARMTRRLDAAAEVKAYGLLGGHVGALIKAMLDEDQTPHDFTDPKVEPRIDVTLMLTTDRSRVRIKPAGPETEMAYATELQKKLLALEPAPAYLVLGGSLPGRKIPTNIPREFYGQLITEFKAKKPATKIVVDAADLELGHAVERGCYMIKPNAEEMSVLAGRKALNTDKDYLAAAEGVMGRFAIEVIAITLGKAGAIIVTKERRFKLSSPAIEPLSSTGAGASFVAAVVFALDKGQGLEDAAKLGVAAGAATAATRSTALPTGDEVRKLLPGVRAETL